MGKMGKKDYVEYARDYKEFKDDIDEYAPQTQHPGEVRGTYSCYVQTEKISKTIRRVVPPRPSESTRVQSGNTELQSRRSALEARRCMPTVRTSKGKLLKKVACVESINPSSRHKDVANRPLSRRERKRLAARAHAAMHDLFCDVVVRHGVIDDSELETPHYVSFPFARLPADVVCNCLLHYVEPSDIHTLRKTFYGLNALLAKNDEVWRTLFLVQSMSETFKARYRRLRRKQVASAPMSWENIVNHISATNTDANEVKQRDAKRRQFMQSRGSALIRHELTLKTSLWDTQIIDGYKRHSDAKLFGFRAPLEKHYIDHDGWRHRWNGWRYGWSRAKISVCRVYESYTNVSKVEERRSVVFKSQYTCPHRNVVLDTTNHWFRCIDCALITHATFSHRDDVWKCDAESFWRDTTADVVLL